MSRAPVDALCRDCLTLFSGAPPRPRCPSCGSLRCVAHPELLDLSIAHLDADAFFAAVEKRDRPELRDKPVIVGGGRRGVVATCCYIARLSGVRSAMPMFRALERRPDAVVIAPRPDVYAAESRRIRAMMQALTPLVAPLSLDEAAMDLSGTARLHGAPPAVILARLQRRVEAETGLTVSIGLSHNRFLAKLASELDKPRGFAVIGRAETAARLAPMAARSLPGVGPTLGAALARAGIGTVADLRGAGRDALIRAHGAAGLRLWDLAHGRDPRPVRPQSAPKSLSSETTFADNLSDVAALRAHLWRLSQKVSGRMKAGALSGRVVTLKLKCADFTLLTRRRSLSAPTELADRLYRVGVELLDAEMARAPFRLIGIGLSDLRGAPGEEDMLDPAALARGRAERAMDEIRRRFGDASIMQGRGLTQVDDS